MKNENLENKNLVLFENNEIRRTFYEGEWFYSIVDVVRILTEEKEYQKSRKNWNKIKERISKDENFELVTICHQFKMKAQDGKMRLTDCANREAIFRIIQSIPSKRAEPFKLWFARLAEDRIQEVIEPFLAITRARETYFKKGYDEEWINARIKGIGVRNELTNEWKNRGANLDDYGILTDEISKGTFDVTTGEHKKIKGLKKENLRDNMTSMELALMTLAEVTTTEIHKVEDSKGFDKLKKDSKEGGEITGETRKRIEKRLNKSIVSSENAKELTKPKQLNN